ncbi:hypothetical protein [Metallosphaera cuprina]|uniref:ABC transporter permease n=1 Tax=Metallosphaera cuprina (strain Ar-4) TaxID=1006006 RepID=F4FY30_METCR|nr:hypothetical protein [Metallosphaera cuprina]AEB95403.1 conserved hypothetical protein [Metallosphaera cuprina Ar-4]
MRRTSRINPRALSWSIGAGIGYSFVLTVIMALSSLIVKGFYPPFEFSIAPIRSLIVSPLEGVVQVLILLALILFVLPIRGNAIVRELTSARNLAIYTSAGYLILSLLPYAISTGYLQAYIGLVIAFNLINGVIAGLASQISLG